MRRRMRDDIRYAIAGLTCCLIVVLVLIVVFEILARLNGGDKDE